eukprot:1153335-Rhodomonas_salina.1
MVSPEARGRGATAELKRWSPLVARITMSVGSACRLDLPPPVLKFGALPGPDDEELDLRGPAEEERDRLDEPSRTATATSLMAAWSSSVRRSSFASSFCSNCSSRPTTPSTLFSASVGPTGVRVTVRAPALLAVGGVGGGPHCLTAALRFTYPGRSPGTGRASSARRRLDIESSSASG